MLLKYQVSTSQRNQFINITGMVQEAVEKSAVRNGTVVIFCPHTTAGITINENADPDVVRDIRKKLALLVPENDGYHHSEGNSDSHVKSSIIGASETVIIENGSLVLGTWQSIYFCEFDGPRNRNVFFKIMA